MASESSMDVDGGSSTARTGAGARAPQPQRPSWRPRLVAYAAATSSSTSGGSLSTIYTSGGSHLQSSSSGDGGLAPPVALFTRLDLEEEREKMRRHIMCLVQEFTAAGDDEEATALFLAKWFSDLGISWVLSIATDGNSSARAFIFPQRLGDLARSWIDALMVIGPSIQHNLSTNSGEGAVPAEKKLQALLDVRDALFVISERILTQLRFGCSHIEGSIRAIIEQTSSVLSAKMAKLDEAVRDTVDEVRTRIAPMMMDDNHNAADSPDIHKATRSIVNCINVISSNYGLVRHIVTKGAGLGKYYVPHDYIFSHPFSDPLATLVRGMVSSLQENLARVSQPFPDQSLRFLFLLNNTHFMLQQLHHPSSYGLELIYMPTLARQIDEHIQRYPQAAWIPVASGLHDPTPLCLGRYSPLAKFESEFKKTYTAQKLWKVPDPQLRRRLRKAIIETVIPAFTKYLEGNKITAPRVTQQELEDMLQDLFEG